MIKTWLILVLGLSSILLVGCGEGQIFEDPSQRATREAGGTQAVSTLSFQETMVPTLVALQSTIDHIPVMQTQQVQLEQQNAFLQATMRAMGGVQPVAPTAQNPAPALTPANPAVSVSDEHYQDVGTASGINEATGCTLGFNDTFYINGPADPTRIYFTTRALDVVAGTTFQVRWYFGAELRYESTTWTADQYYDETCVYFWMDSNDTPYAGGYWSAELMANGRSVARTRFAMCEPGIFC